MKSSWSSVGVALVLAGAMTLAPGVASAQQVVQETTTSTGPDFRLVTSGIVIFGAAYVPSVIVAGSSSINADRTLAVPLAGPWIDYTQRPSCGPPTQCNGENTSRVLLVVDGIVQAVGALTVLDGLLSRESTTTTVARTTDAPTLHLRPLGLGSGYGMAAIGTF